VAHASFRRELLETLVVVAGFVGFGFGWAGLEERATRLAETYPFPVMGELLSRSSTWLVDGFNVLHAGVLRGRDRSEWWTERRRAELLARAAAFDDPEAEIWVVFDGPGQDPSAEPPTGRLRQVFAPSADDWLLARVRSARDPSRLAVVTGDRQVAGRARHRGARVVSPTAFLGRCGGGDVHREADLPRE
jgi:hypothetical protein